jgi:hypothetical protein
MQLGLNQPLYISTADLPTDAMRQFMAQDTRWVASFINACEQRAQDDPPDEVVFGDPVDTDHESADEFVDCSEGGADDDVFELLDRILASDGFVSVTP